MILEEKNSHRSTYWPVTACSTVFWEMPCGAMIHAGIPMYDVSIFGTRGALLNNVVPTLGTDDKSLRLVEVCILGTEDILLHAVTPSLGNAGMPTLGIE